MTGICDNSAIRLRADDATSGDRLSEIPISARNERHV
jgi:hypothetical protein